MGPADVAGLQQEGPVRRARARPGVGVAPGPRRHRPVRALGLAPTPRHRIDPDPVKADMNAAGFVFDQAESKVFASAADDHTKLVFDPSIRGKTGPVQVPSSSPARGAGA